MHCIVIKFVICYYEWGSLGSPENVNANKVHTSLLWRILCHGGAPRSGPEIDRHARLIIRFVIRICLIRTRIRICLMILFDN